MIVNKISARSDDHFMWERKVAAKTTTNASRATGLGVSVPARTLTARANGAPMRKASETTEARRLPRITSALSAPTDIPRGSRTIDFDHGGDPHSRLQILEHEG